MTGDSLGAAARTLVGTPFRLHGRDCAKGIDCIGVLSVALGMIGRPAPLPAAYSVRTRAVSDLESIVTASGFVAARGTPLVGDVMLVRLGPVQLHLLIATGDDCFVHAHAGLGRVLLSQLPENCKVVGHWRLDTSCEAG